MRCGAVRCGAMRCDAVVCDACLDRVTEIEELAFVFSLSASIPNDNDAVSHFHATVCTSTLAHALMRFSVWPLMPSTRWHTHMYTWTCMRARAHARTHACRHAHGLEALEVAAHGSDAALVS